jgi:hypothetical protein
VPTFFETNGIMREWDTVPASLAIALEAVCARLQPPPLFDTLRRAIDWLQVHETPPIEIDYYSKIRSLLPYRKAGKLFTESVLESRRQEDGNTLFPCLSRQGVFEELFANSRDIHQSLTTRVFQNVILGDKVYEEAYGLPAEVSCPSFNELYDRSTLDARLSRALNAQVRAGKVNLAVMTARPCWPPERDGRSEVGYAPEAENVLKLVGMPDIPIIGYGSLTAAAKRYAVSTYDLLKPSGFHALAAFALSWFKDGWQALEWAAGAWLGDRARLSDLNGLPRSVELHVFEDSPNGILSAKKAAEALRSAGFEIDLRLWGIVSDLADSFALKANGAVILPDINQALLQAFEGLRID